MSGTILGQYQGVLIQGNEKVTLAILQSTFGWEDAYFGYAWGKKKKLRGTNVPEGIRIPCISMNETPVLFDRNAKVSLERLISHDQVRAIDCPVESKFVRFPVEDAAHADTVLQEAFSKVHEEAHYIGLRKPDNSGSQHIVVDDDKVRTWRSVMYHQAEQKDLSRLGEEHLANITLKEESAKISIGLSSTTFRDDIKIEHLSLIQALYEQLGISPPEQEAPSDPSDTISWAFQGFWYTDEEQFFDVLRKAYEKSEHTLKQPKEYQVGSNGVAYLSDGKSYDKTLFTSKTRYSGGNVFLLQQEGLFGIDMHKKLYSAICSIIKKEEITTITPLALPLHQYDWFQFHEDQPDQTLSTAYQTLTGRTPQLSWKQRGLSKHKTLFVNGEKKHITYDDRNQLLRLRLGSNKWMMRKANVEPIALAYVIAKEWLSPTAS